MIGQLSRLVAGISLAKSSWLPEYSGDSEGEGGREGGREGGSKTILRRCVWTVSPPGWLRLPPSLLLRFSEATILLVMS